MHVSFDASALKCDRLTVNSTGSIFHLEIHSLHPWVAFQVWRHLQRRLRCLH